MKEGGDTIFGKIIRREIPADIVFESETVLAFKDIAPVAPVHIVIIPKRPLRSIGAALEEDKLLLGELLFAAAEVARNLGLSNDGYRVVTNIDQNGGQTVFHLHLHLLGGRQMLWPPG
jgi:histidine triad (HIT) family protein